MPEEQRSLIEKRLEAACFHVNKVCGNQFTCHEIADFEVITTMKFPPDVELGIAKLVDYMGDSMASSGVASYSLESMSKSFFQGEQYRSCSMYWRPYARKLRFY